MVAIRVAREGVMERVEGVREKVEGGRGRALATTTVAMAAAVGEGKEQQLVVEAKRIARTPACSVSSRAVPTAKVRAAWAVQGGGNEWV